MNAAHDYGLQSFPLSQVHALVLVHGLCQYLWCLPDATGMMFISRKRSSCQTWKQKGLKVLLVLRMRLLWVEAHHGVLRCTTVSTHAS